MTDVRTNIVIITYNALSYTRATLTSLFKSTDEPYHLTIIDNGSRQDTLTFLRQLQVPDQCKKYELIANNHNAGVGVAYTQGQSVSFNDGVEFTAFCNNDLYFSRDWLNRLEARMDTYPNIAMLSPLRPSAKVAYDETISTRDALLRLLETDQWVDELMQYTGRSLDNFDEFCDHIIQKNGNGAVEFISFPDSLSTCVCLTRNSCFSVIGQFADPIFTGYGGEDIDMSWTIMGLGYQCAVDHSVYVHHFRGKSLKDNTLDRVDLLKKSNKILYEKWSYQIRKHIQEQMDKKVDVVAQIRTGSSNRYWLLHELDRDEQFTKSFDNV